MQILPRHRRRARTARPTPLKEAGAAGEPHVRAAVTLAQALRCRGLVAAEAAGTDGTARVLIITPAAARLAEQIYVAGDGKPWFWRSGQPLCPADDITTAADTITHLLAADAARRHGRTPR